MLKYEEVHLHVHDDLSQARRGITCYARQYNRGRKHASLGRRMPDRVYAAVDMCFVSRHRKPSIGAQRRNWPAKPFYE